MSYIAEYRDKILSGEIIAGRYIHLELDRLSHDLADPDVKMDYDASNKRIQFIEHELRHGQAPFAGKPFKLELFQKAIIEAIFAPHIYDTELKRWVRKYQDVLLVEARKNGKDLALDTPIPTPSGWTTMGKLQPGDMVFSQSGSPSRVLAVSPVYQHNDCYEVTFEDGERIIAGSGHLWTVTVKKPKGVYVTRTTAELSRNYKHERCDGKGIEYRYRVPMQRPLKLSHKALPIHPYILGYWLGNGDSDSARITCHKRDLPALSQQFDRCGYPVKSIQEQRGQCVRACLDGLQKKLRATGLLNHKIIPAEYLRGSLGQRMALVQGLMDSDGYCSKAGQCEFCQRDESLTKQVSELLSSLGIKHTIIEKGIELNGKLHHAFYTRFYCSQENPCFRLERKRSRLKKKPAERMKAKSIVSIQPIGSVPTKCIAIDDPTHLYLAGLRMTATHNSPLAAATSLAEWVCGPMGGNILYGSNDFDQSDILFQCANDMREESPKLARCTHKNQKGIFWGNQKQKHARGKFSRQNKGTIKKLSARQSAKEGKNISIGVVDEVHEMQDNTLVMPIRQALSTQDEPLYIEITTEGFTDGGYLDERMALAKQVLMGEAEMPRWLIFLYQQDTEEEIFQDERSWYKANPGMGTIKKWSFMRQMVDEARTNRKTRAFVLAKDFNIKQNTAAAWLESATIENPRTFAPEELDGQYYIGSLDFAETTDLCSAKALFVDPWTRQKKTLSMYFVPEIKAEALGTENGDALNPEQKDYREWAREGLVTICPGTEVDAKMVADWFLKLYDDYHVIPFKIGYDNWHAKDFKKYIGEYFGDEVLERIIMDYLSLSNPMSALESDLRRKVLNYNDNPIDKWCLANTAFKVNNLGMMMPVKVYGQSKNRIDGALGFIIAYAAYGRFKSEYHEHQKSVLPEPGPGGDIRC